MKSKKIILDTNLWISFLITRNFEDMGKLMENQKIILLFSNELLEEFIDVVQRPKFNKYFSQKEIQKLLNIFDEFARLVQITSSLDICRDEKDNFLLNLAVDGKADFLITGDKDLLVLGKIKKTRIMTYREFIESI